jgi:hypothetical protein
VLGLNKTEIKPIKRQETPVFKIFGPLLKKSACNFNESENRADPRIWIQIKRFLACKLFLFHWKKLHKILRNPRTPQSKPLKEITPPPRSEQSRSGSTTLFLSMGGTTHYTTSRQVSTNTNLGCNVVEKAGWTLLHHVLDAHAHLDVLNQPPEELDEVLPFP